MKKLLVGVSALAIGLVASSGAWANPKNTFSSGVVQTVISTAIAGGAAFSESFNVNQEAVSVQTLNGASVGGSLSVEVIPIFSGNAITGTQSGNSGVTMAQANSGNTSVQQQGVALSAVGTVNF
ncbi:MAG TPA: hypothetical protein VG742_19095 [Dongiaceae bacterium]|nr:hypothetical protein [Dongiaceae bacterium]